VLLTNEDQMKRWAEHFHEVLNQPESTILFNFEQESNIACIVITVQEITAEEVKAINSQKNNKSTWHSSRTHEIWKNTLAEELTVIQCHLE